MTIRQGKSYKWLIILASVLIPVAVAVLYIIPKSAFEELDVSFLPAVNATINGTVSLVLILAFIAIRQKNIVLHKKLMTGALILSCLFLVSYVLYHMTTPSTKFGGEGLVSYIYYFILLTHILLAIVIVPLVLISFVRALSEKFDKHKKIARITLPLWLYVSITGVLVYWMISPYY